MVIHWTQSNQLLSFVRHLNKIICYAIHVSAYSGRFRTPATSKMKHFVTKKLANAFQKKKKNKKTQEIWEEKKMNIAADKYPWANTVKILHECFFLSK